MAHHYYFLHGLDSSGSGTKGKFFQHNFPHVVCPDFSGSLQDRLTDLQQLCSNKKNITFIGSSFGGLMATCFAIEFPQKVEGLYLLAPALNFPGFTPPKNKLTIPVSLYIGKQDSVTPPSKVLPLAQETFISPFIHLAEDDHLLHNTFQNIDWPTLLEAL